MDAIVGFFGSETFLSVILPLVLTGAFGPAAFSALLLLLSAPGFVHTCDLGMRLAGLWFSAMATRMLDRIAGAGYGEKLEDALERFVQGRIAAFWAGADSDDRADAALVTAADVEVHERVAEVVAVAVQAVEETAVAAKGVGTPIPSAEKENRAVEIVKNTLRREGTPLAKKALKLVTDKAIRGLIGITVGRLFPH